MNDLTAIVLGGLLVGAIVLTGVAGRQLLTDKPPETLSPISFIDQGKCRTMYFPQSKLTDKKYWLESWYVDSFYGECKQQDDE